MNKWKREKTNKKTRHNKFLVSPFSFTPRNHVLPALTEHQNPHHNSRKHHVPIIWHHPQEPTLKLQIHTQLEALFRSQRFDDRDAV